jgi:hypothetical protein
MCDPGFYADNGQCFACPQGAECNQTDAARLVVARGYWRQ